MTKGTAANGLRNRVVRQIAMLVVLLVAIGIGATTMVLTKIISDQRDRSLAKIAHEYLQDLDLYFSFLDQTIVRFSKNQLVVKSLIDPKGREVYLPQLAKEFSLTSFVRDLAVVDFAGKQIYGRTEQIAVAPDHSYLRKALATETRTIELLPQDLTLRVIQPVVYYQTTQGAVVVTLDLGAMLREILSVDSTSFYQVYSGDRLLLKLNEQLGVSYVLVKHHHEQEETSPYVRQMHLSLDIGWFGF